MILKIRQVGEPVLRHKSHPLPLDQIQGQYIQSLIESMRETMRDATGVGLAAPQIGEPLQLVVIEDPPEAIQKLSVEQARERERRPVPFQVLINPVLTIPASVTAEFFASATAEFFASATAEFFEGCLSLAGYTALVPRQTQVHVECLNEKAELVSIDATGWYARILQHDIDHLNGILYIDRMNPRSFTTQDNHTRNWKDKSVADIKKAISADQPDTSNSYT